MQGNQEPLRLSSPGLPDRKLESAALDQNLFQEARRAYQQEDYSTSLRLVRECLDRISAQHLDPLAIVPGPGKALVKDGVVLWAWNLFQLDRFNDLEVLMASAGRWGLVPEQLPELEVVHLSFALKRAQYDRVVVETSRFINAARQELPPVIADFLHLRGLARSGMGDPDGAYDDAESAYSLFRVLGKDLESAKTANLMGILHFRSADFAGSEKWFRRALNLHKKLGMRKNMGGNLLNLGITCYKRGEFTRALTEFDAARLQLEKVGASVSLCRETIARGNTLRHLRRFDEAQETLLAAFEQAGGLQLAREEALALEFLGDVARDQGFVEKARRYYSRALAVGRSLAPDGDIVMEVMRRQGQCLTALGRESEAVSILNRGLAMARSQGDRFEEGVGRRALAEALFGLGDLESAYRHSAQAIALLDEVAASHEMAKARLTRVEVGLARMDSGMGVDPVPALEESWRQALAALDIFLRTGVEHWTREARRTLTRVSNLRSEVENAQALSVQTAGQAGNARRANTTTIVHVSSRMRDLLQMTDAFADSGEPVLVTGATGTGKELFARRLHERSGRRNGEMVCVNVTAIPESVFAREFFGHVKGSFSGADQDGIGLAEQAHGGTLFLDEIGELPLSLQPRLLRLLQDGTYHALGDPAERRVDIRLVAATNADLEQMVAQGTFRADLYYRLKILELRIPPIKDRREDIIPLLRHFLSQGEDKLVQPSEFFNGRSLELMEGYDWPGNVREIAMVASQARVQLASCGGVRIELGGLEGQPLILEGPEQDSDSADIAGSQDLCPDRRSLILMTLAETEGNRAMAARKLGVSRSTLYRNMEKLGIL
jgi:anaerobic nitric oxide reductase transcription regulator